MENNVSLFIGVVATYDPDGQIIWGLDENGEHQRIADVRGWGAIQNLFKSKNGKIDSDKAMEFQDEMGKWIADAINEKLEREKQSQVKQ